jgi:hypothetical protein
MTQRLLRFLQRKRAIPTTPLPKSRIELGIGVWAVLISCLDGWNEFIWPKGFDDRSFLQEDMPGKLINAPSANTVRYFDNGFMSSLLLQFMVCLGQSSILLLKQYLFQLGEIKFTFLITITILDN